MGVTVGDIQAWLLSLAEDTFPEDEILEGTPGQPVQRVLTCWMPNREAREAALAFGADLVIMHEAHVYTDTWDDPGTRRVADWPVTRESLAFYRDNGIALIRSHRTQDSYCMPFVFARRLGLGEPVHRSGWKGYDFTLVYEVPPTPFPELAAAFRQRMGHSTIRISHGHGDVIVRRVGLGWGGLTLSRNLQYVETLREQGIDAITCGEVDEYAIDYYRDNDLPWIELGHYATEVLGMEFLANDLKRRFPELDSTCCLERQPRVDYL